jgi:prepilin-type processing-associated H-X9-DG protein
MRRISIMAVLSAVLGLTGPVAILLGLRSLRQINQSEGRLAGRGFAIAGMLMGAVTTIAFVIGMVALVMVSLRGKDARRRCENHLRQLGQALNSYHDTNGFFPAGTIPDPQLPVEKRWSWQAALLVHVSANRPKNVSLAGMSVEAEIDTKKAWDDPANAAAVDTELRRLVCPAYSDLPGTNEPGVTNYLGIAGIGADAPLLSGADPRAGVFGYDRHTNRDQVTRGLSYTMLSAETAYEVGPWAAGGPSTVRGVLPDDPEPIGPGRRWGGLHAGGLNLLMADGSAQFRSATIAPKLFVDMATIHGD